MQAFYLAANKIRFHIHDIGRFGAVHHKSQWHGVVNDALQERACRFQTDGLMQKRLPCLAHIHAVAGNVVKPEVVEHGAKKRLEGKYRTPGCGYEAYPAGLNALDGIDCLGWQPMMRIEQRVVQIAKNCLDRVCEGREAIYSAQRRDVR